MKIFLSILCLALLGLTGCSSVGKLGGITATPLDFRLLSPTEARITMRLDNENVTAMGLDTSIHKLFFKGTLVAQGVSKAPIGLVAMNSSSQDVTLKIENIAFIRSLGNISSVPYSLDSVLKLTSGEVRFEMNSHAEGSLSVSGLDNAK